LGKLIIVQGKTGPGKTRWIEKWLNEAPTERMVALSVAGVAHALKMGCDVAIDATGAGLELVTVA
jgi:hypothetical protein